MEINDSSFMKCGPPMNPLLWAGFGFLCPRGHARLIARSRQARIVGCGESWQSWQSWVVGGWKGWPSTPGALKDGDGKLWGSYLEQVALSRLSWGIFFLLVALIRLRTWKMRRGSFTCALLGEIVIARTSGRSRRPPATGA